MKKILNDLNIHLPRFTPDEIEANSGAADFLGVNHYMNRVSMNSISYVTLFVSRSNGNGHLYDDSSAPSLHGKNREIGAKEVNIKVSMPFIS